MGEMGNVIQTQLMMLCLIGVGVLVAKIKLVSPQVTGVLSTLVVNVFLPCNLVSVFMSKDFDTGLIGSFVAAAVAGTVACTAVFFGSKLLFAKVKDDRNLILRYALLNPNVGFVGIPVIGGLYGQIGLFYLSAFLIPLNIFMWGFGLSYFEKMDMRNTLVKILKNPPLIGIAAGIVLMLSGLTVPQFIADTLSSLGACTTPMSLLVTGAVLAGISPKSIINGPSVYYSILRLVLIPLAAMGIMMLCGLPPLVTAVTVMSLAMPAATAVVMVAQIYKGNAGYGSQIIFISTVISMVTIPLMAMLVDRVLGL